MNMLRRYCGSKPSPKSIESDAVSPLGLRNSGSSKSLSLIHTVHQQQSKTNRMPCLFKLPNFSLTIIQENTDGFDVLFQMDLK